ncbi:MAG TPA: hypothetical protein VGK03_12845 [Geothrix sp.]|jgi:hypothetical protein
MKRVLALGILLMVGCKAPVDNQHAQPLTRKVAFQPPLIPVPKPVDGKSGVYPTTVDLVIDSAGSVSQVIPRSGAEPFLSTTLDYAKLWRFSPNFPTTPESLVSLKVTYTWGAIKTIDINIKP